MSLDVTLVGEVFSSNITHNLGRMAEEAGIYKHVWHPEDLLIKYASQMIVPLQTAIALMNKDPDRFKKFDSPNGWGMYEHFLPWLERYLWACEENPSAEIRVSR